MHAHVQSRTQLQALPDHVLELMFERLKVSDCAACCCASQELNALGKVFLPVYAALVLDKLPSAVAHLMYSGAIGYSSTQLCLRHPQRPLGRLKADSAECAV